MIKKIRLPCLNRTLSARRRACRIVAGLTGRGSAQSRVGGRVDCIFWQDVGAKHSVPSRGKQMRLLVAAINCKTSRVEKI